MCNKTINYILDSFRTGGKRQSDLNIHQKGVHSHYIGLNQSKEDVIMMFRLSIISLLLISSFTLSAAEYIGNYSSNPYNTNSTSNRYGAGSQYNNNSTNNSYGTYGNPYSNKSATNPYATNAPKLYDSQGNYKGKLSNNPYDPDSVSNPYGKYGSKYSADSINNPYGAGSPYNSDSPNNRYGNGLRVYGQ